METISLRHSSSTLGAFLLAGLLGCGSDSESPSNPEPGPDISGDWTLVEAIHNSASGIACGDTAVLYLTPTNPGFDGTISQVGLCQTPNGPVSNYGVGPITNGTTSASAVGFKAGGCKYRGSLFHDPPDSADGTVSCETGNGGPKLTGSWWAVTGGDSVAPRIPNWQVISNDRYILPGDSIGIQVEVHDDRALSYVGIEVGPPINIRDSVVVTGKDVVHIFPFLTTAAWIGQRDYTIFAGDWLGRVDTVTGAQVGVWDMIRRPLHSLDLGGMASGLAYDGKRERLYVGVPSQGQIKVVNLAGFTELSPYNVIPASTPSNAALVTLDITPGGDSVVFSPGNTDDSTAVVLNLLTGQTTPLGIVSAGGLRVTAQGLWLTKHDRLVVFGTTYDQGFLTYGLWGYDLASQTPREYSAGIGAVSEGGRTSDGTHFSLVTYLPVDCAFAIDPATDALSACHALGFAASDLQLTANQAGTRWLVDGHVLDQNLVEIMTVPSGASSQGGTISPDGLSVWYPRFFGVEQIRLSDGASIERIRVPNSDPFRLQILPDGKRLLIEAGSLTTLTMIDLP
ncbi:MAG TPA: hypothetical protein VLA89_16005 [Gemmatimonadales bacterium]|nr:hypothetical protein [Gemmatimonadales bacterium]